MLIEGIRVNRADLRSPSASPTPSVDPEAANELRACLDHVLGEVVVVGPGPAETTNQQPAAVDSDEDVEFRLFRSAAPSRVRIRSPTPINKEPGLAGPPRSLSYYFTGVISAEKEREFTQVTLSGNDVLKLSQSQWYGCALPWRVVKGEGTKVLQDAEKPERKRRLGKKHRIALRKKSAAETAKKEAAQRQLEDKEAYLREKKSKKNRERQLKRRAKEKAKKAEVTTGAGEAPGDDAEMDDAAASVGTAPE